jgi:hypothetical protein
MPKYYIDAGEFRTVIDSPDHNIAAVKAFELLENQPVRSLRSITIVSEKGFNSANENDWYFSTLELLEQSNQIRNYKPE